VLRHSTREQNKLQPNDLRHLIANYFPNIKGIVFPIQRRRWMSPRKNKNKIQIKEENLTKQVSLRAGNTTYANWFFSTPHPLSFLFSLL